MGEEDRMVPHVLSLLDFPDSQAFLDLVPSLIDVNLDILSRIRSDTMFHASLMLVLLATIAFTFAAPSVTLPLEVKDGRGELQMLNLGDTLTDARELQISDVL